MATPEVLTQITEAGVSIWLDDLSRSRVQSGNLQELIDTRAVRGVTTNPSIFATALSDGELYQEQLMEVLKEEHSAEHVVFSLTTTDVRDAAAIFQPLYESSGGKDGRVSIEVDPRLAHDTAGTIRQASELWEKVGRDNVLIKIPATKAGIPAITAVIAQGISVNVTLIFSLERYAEVIEAYLAGLEQAQVAGIDISKIHSVASFFVSRIDTEVDSRLDALGTDEAAALRSKAALANARLAYQLFEQEFATERAASLLSSGAQLQRPLWASTGVKDPNLPDTLYVSGLVAKNVVNTVPEKTLQATADHGSFEGDTITGSYQESAAVISALEGLGISLQEVTQKLEDEGVAKFIDSWSELLDNVSATIKDL